jgi:hypothetical protein
MQDEHFMKLWAEAHQDFSAGVDQLRERAGMIGQAYDGAWSPDTLLAACRERLAGLLSWAIPGGFLAGTVAAAIAAAATMPPTPRLVTVYHPSVASFTLPYAA